MEAMRPYCKETRGVSNRCEEKRGEWATHFRLEHERLLLLRLLAVLAALTLLRLPRPAS